MLISLIFAVEANCLETTNISVIGYKNGNSESFSISNAKEIKFEISKFIKNEYSEIIVKGNGEKLDINDISLQNSINNLEKIKWNNFSIDITSLASQNTMNTDVIFECCTLNISNIQNSFDVDQNIQITITNSTINISNIYNFLFTSHVDLVIQDSTISTNISNPLFKNINLTVIDSSIINSTIDTILISQSNNCIIKNCQFIKNIFLSPLIIGQSGNVIIESTIFNRILYKSNVCLIDSQSDSEIKLSDCNFTKVFGPQDYSTIFDIKNTKNIMFSQIFVEKQNNIFALFNNSKFSIEKSNFSIVNCIISAYKSIGSLSKCNFENCTEISTIDSTNSSLTLDTCKFIRSSAKHGSAVLAKNYSTISMIDVSAYFCSATEAAAVVFISNSSLSTDMCTFKHNSAPFAPSLFIENSQNVFIKRTESKFNNGHFTFIYAAGNTSLTINSVRIDDSYENAVFCGENVEVDLENAYFKCLGRCQPVFQHIKAKTKQIQSISIYSRRIPSITFINKNNTPEGVIIVIIISIIYIIYLAFYPKVIKKWRIWSISKKKHDFYEA